jgi:hypothetical protein
VTEESAPSPSNGTKPRDRGLPPISLLLYVPALLPVLALGSAVVPSLAWAGACAWGCEQAFPRARTRHLAGALLALLGSAALVFLVAQGLRPLAALLFVPPAVLWGLARLGPPWVLQALRAAPAGTAVVSALIFWAFYSFGARVGPFPRPDDDFLFALRADPVPEPLQQDERDAAIRVVRASLRGEALDPASLPARLREPSPGRVYVTLFQRPDEPGKGQETRKRRGASEPGPLHAALAAATPPLRKPGSTPGRTGEFSAERASIVVDLAGPEAAIRPTPLRRALQWSMEKLSGGRRPWDLLVYDAEPGVDGFRLRGPRGEGLVLPGDVVYEGWLTPRSNQKRWRADNLERIWKELQTRAGSGRTAPGSVEVWNFRTRSFAAPDPGSERSIELYRGNALIDGDLDEAQLLLGIAGAGRWLLRQVEADGRFDYEYFPNPDRHGSGYNEVRHAGSVYGLFHMYRLARAEPELRAEAAAYLEAGIRAMDRVYGNLGPPPGTAESDGLLTFREGEDGEKSNSGAPSLTLLAFMVRPPPEDVDDPELRARLQRDGDDERMLSLARMLVRMIDADGRVFEKWTEAAAGGRVQKEPLYYPGEAMLALSLLAERTGNGEFLEAARRIGRRQVADAKRPWVTPDHWVMQALDVIDRAAPDEALWRQGAYAMGRRYVSEIYGGSDLGRGFLRPPFPDYRGAYRRNQEVPRTTRAASRGEALGGVARIAWRRGDPSDAWERSLLEGARHLLEQMYGPDNSFFLPDPQEVAGAIRMGIVDNHCRIDNNQHGIVGLDNALAALRRRSGREPSAR